MCAKFAFLESTHLFFLLYTGHIDSGHYDVLLPITKKNDNE
jgi:hypothetical protein